MNRAILVVICDFLVSAMLSMMTGMVPSHTGGTGVGLDENTTQVLLAQLDAGKKELERVRRELREAAEKLGTRQHDAQLREIARQLAENRFKREQLEEFLKRTAANTGKLSAETLKKRLDDEKIRRYQAEIELREKQESLSQARENIKEYRSENSTLRSETSALRRELSESGKALREMTSSYIAAQRQTAQAEARAAAEKKASSQKDLELARKEAEIVRKSSDLSAVRDALKEMSQRVNQSNVQTQKLQNTLAFTTGKLSSTERDLAGYRDRLNRLQKELASVTLQRNEAVRHRGEMETLVRKTVSDLAQVRTDLEQTKIAAEKDHKRAITAQAKLAATQTMLEDTRRQLQSNVLESYSDAAVRLRVKVSEQRLLVNRQGGGLYYLPLLNFNKRTYLAGHFKVLAGNAETPMLFRNITELLFSGAKPSSAAPETQIKGPLLALSYNPYITALEVKIPDVKPLEVLTRSQLAKRGMARLYLFKNRSFGRESAELGGRCSYDLFNKSGSLIIRNSSRGTGSELKAEPGDFILAGEGKFVGIVTELRSEDFDRKQTARVFVFPDENVWEKAEQIKLSSKNGKFVDFAAYARRTDREIMEAAIKAKREK